MQPHPGVPTDSRSSDLIRRLPAEWERQRMALLTWPHAGGDWGSDLAAAEAAFLDLARAIAKHQPLVIACQDERIADRVSTALRNAGTVSVHTVPSDDIWIRDHGPITVLDGDNRPRLLDFRFNGWGGKYPASRDDAVSRSLHRLGAFGGLSMESIPWVLEGGSVDSDGAGTLLTTSRCLLDDARNRGTDRPWWEARFHEWFGVNRVLWLDHGELEGDDTDGHVDMLARFVARDTIVHVACDDPADAHHEALQRMEAQLRGFRDASGQPYNLVPLPWPAARYDEERQRLPLSYANFLLINDAVLMPCYDQVRDEAALSLIASLFPRRSVVPVPAMALIRQRGSVHCATQQIVAGRRADW